MKITIIQYNIEWENIRGNLDKVENLINRLPSETDLIILPETFTTGFSMNSIELAEDHPSATLEWMHKMSQKTGSAICGSYITRDTGNYFNRFVFVSPGGKEFKYDKRHLFSIGGENETYTSGTERLVFTYKEFRINAIVCYDLRFPVWIRNRNDYDLLICVANWPESRREVWNTLLKARAIENQCYVAAASRVGNDPVGNTYAGDSAVIDPRGQIISGLPEYEEGIISVELSLSALQDFRTKFPVWKDADEFEIR